MEDSKDLDKEERLLAALDQGMVMIHLDARQTGAIARSGFAAGRGACRLSLSYRFDRYDLTVGEWGDALYAELLGSRFGGVPWSALFAITSHVTKESWMYMEDMPPELLQQPIARRFAAAGASGAGRPRAPSCARCPQAGG